ncbi:MAG: CBS domain-containing protein [Bacteroidetes bacterium]|nr:MAG: CBS domain-containing protein [Bacteroidota bacterium]
MIAEHLISDTLIPLRTSDTGEEALGIMNEFYVRHLPIVNHDEFLGLLSEDEILNNDPGEPVGSYPLRTQQSFVRVNDHLYDVMRLIAEQRLTAIPVLNDDNHYLGLITGEDLIRHFAQSGSFREPGGIVVLEMLRQDYSLSQISQIFESEGAVILSAHVQTFDHTARIEVTLKVNRQYMGSILATLERYGYEVKASFNEVEYFDRLKQRYDGLITYLNV